MSLAADATPKAAPFDLKSPDWVLKLVDLQNDPRAVVAMFEWSPNVIDAASGTTELKRAPATLAGKPGLRLDSARR